VMQSCNSIKKCSMIQLNL